MVGYKRRALDALSRVELLEIGGELGVSLGRDMTREQMQDELAASVRATLACILPRLPRTTLKAVCDAVGLDSTSRGKGPLVERILAGEATAVARKLQRDAAA